MLLDLNWLRPFLFFFFLKRMSNTDVFLPCACAGNNYSPSSAVSSACYAQWKPHTLKSAGLWRHRCTGRLKPAVKYSSVLWPRAYSLLLPSVSFPLHPQMQYKTGLHYSTSDTSVYQYQCKLRLHVVIKDTTVRFLQKMRIAYSCLSTPLFHSVTFKSYWPISSRTSREMSLMSRCLSRCLRDTKFLQVHPIYKWVKQQNYTHGFT